MPNIIALTNLNSAIEDMKTYVAANYSPKSLTHYTGILRELEQYAQGDTRPVADIIKNYYETYVGVPFPGRAENNWMKFKARTVFILLDIIGGNEPKREYTYNADVYSGVFVTEYDAYCVWLLEREKSHATVRANKIHLRPFLRFLENNRIIQPEQIVVDAILAYLQERAENVSVNNRKNSVHAIRGFLASPLFAGKLSFDPMALLTGFRIKKNERLKSWYTTNELKSVMDAVDRTSKWGKTIYAMMLLACVYGLRISDIREMLISSINWNERKIALFQKKTRKYVELPLTVEVKFALLDYYKNVRPESSDPHLFIKHLHPHTPYASYDNFGSKVAAYFKKAGVDTTGKHHGFHSMRFSLATELLAEGVSIDEISSILGHKKIETTKEYVWSDIKHLKIAALEVPVYGNR